MQTVKSQSHLSITPDNNYNVFSRQKCRENVSLFNFFLLYTFLHRWTGGSEDKWSTKSVCPDILCTGAVYRHLIRGIGPYQQAFPFTVRKNRTTCRNKLYGFLDEQDYQVLAGLPVNAAMQSYHRVERITSVIVLILVTLLLTASASKFWSLSMLLQSGYAWVMSALQFLTPPWTLCGPNGVLVRLSGLK